MQIDFLTQKKLRAVISQIDFLLLSDFPHPSSASALNSFRSFFETQSQRLASAIASKNPSLIRQACRTSNLRIVEYLPLLGFLLRSTNVRNNFESYDALLQLSRKLLGISAEVIIASEWDYSPLTYPMNVSVLPNYVLLGLPASESNNALILPLAGHELGHSAWLTEDVANYFVTLIENAARDALKSRFTEFVTAFPEHSSITLTESELLNNMFLVNIVNEITSYALSQTEETFCDGMGMALFGASYAHAFHYLLAPGIGGYRSLEYPRLSGRAQHINIFGRVNLSGIGFSNFATEFEDVQPILSPRQSFTSVVADEIARTLASDAFDQAFSIATAKAQDELPTTDGIAPIVAMYERGVPANRPNNLSDILNAGWEYTRIKGSTFDESERPLLEWVSELVLKSMEVLEFRRRTAHA